jgi:hypothetical protein
MLLFYFTPSSSEFFKIKANIDLIDLIDFS